MESRLRILLLTVVLATLPGCATVRHWFHRDHPSAADSAPAEDDNTPPPRVVDPEAPRRRITLPRTSSFRPRSAVPPPATRALKPSAASVCLPGLRGASRITICR